MQQQNPGIVLKLIVVGSGGVGKSALTLKFMYNEFVEDYEPTKADSYRKKHMLGSEEVLIDILDTAGQEDYQGIRDNYFRTGEGFIFVFSVDDEDSLNQLDSVYDQVCRAKNTDDLPMLLVMNKSDLLQSPDNKIMAEGLKKANLFRMELVNTSAKTGLNVEMVFHKVASQVRARQLASVQQTKVPINRKPRRRCTIL